MHYTLLTTLLALPLAHSLSVGPHKDCPKDVSVVDPQFLGFAIEVGSLTDYTGVFRNGVAMTLLSNLQETSLPQTTGP